MNAPATVSWLARHEVSLAWRDFIMMMTAGKPQRRMVVLAVGAFAIAALHLLSWSILSPAMEGDPDPLLVLIMAMGSVSLAFSLMGSQAMESITRVFYSRSDLDLVLSSPLRPQRIFTIKLGGVVLSTTLLSMLMAAPAINVLALIDSYRWLLAYPFALALGTIASVLALCLTLLLFRTIGARRTRTAAQITAAVIGALFIIGIQLVAIASIGSISRLELLRSDLIRSAAPSLDSLFWLPARAATGDVTSTAFFIAFAAVSFGLAVAVFPQRFADTVLAVSGLGEMRRSTRAGKFRALSVATALRVKEWKLLARDHWLISQTLMQMLYLAPPAFMLWQGFGGGAIPTVIVPVLVMASGQLAGGLAWLAISGEDAPQLVATAPVPRHAVIRAKIEAVLVVIAVIVLPILAFMSMFDAITAAICAAGIAASSVAAVTVQLWFRSQAKRSSFRRRQTSSRIATFAEAFSSIFWAGATALAASGSIYAFALIALALSVLWITYLLRPNPIGEFAY